MPSKFIKQDTKFLAEVEKAIKSEIKRRNFCFGHEVFNIKHLTECPRRISYRAHGFDTKKTPETQIFLADRDLKYTKKKWVELFSQIPNIVVIDTNILAADANFNISGTVDAIIKCGSWVGALMVDVVDAENYAKAKETGGLRRQIVEVMTAAWLVEVPNGILLCENRVTNEYFFSHVIAHPPVIRGVKDKCRRLMQQQILQQLPDKPYKDDSSKECQVCEYRKTCWKT